MAEQTFDVAVIGAGMLGAAAAFHLSRAGARVAVLDAGEPAGGATGNTFAWLNAVGKTPEAYHRLNAAGMAEYERLHPLIPAVEPRGPGCLEWAGDPERQAALEAKVERLRGWGYPARLISRAEARAREPGLVFGEGVAAIALYERDRWVDAPAVVRTLLEHVRQAGGAVQTRAPVLGFAGVDERVTAVDTAAGTIAVAAVLLCAGTGTPALAAKLGVRLPVRRSPGLLAVTTPITPSPLGHVVYAPGVHVRPDVSGGLRIGADDIDALTSETTPPGPPPDWALPLLARAAAVLPAAAASRIERVHIGIRPVPADGYTAAGRLPGCANAYVAVTHSGITLGLLLGRLMAEEIAGASPDPLLAPFRPERFADQSLGAGRPPAH